jgi:hypothetical protein
VLLAAWLIPALLVMLGAGLVAAGSADARLPLTQCEDGIDNDGDGQIDSPWDPGCVNANDPDNSEADLAVPPLCSNKVDDDADGKPDFPLDPQCRTAGDTREAGAGVTPCSDGIDNDVPVDGLIDYPLDLKCLWAADPQEVARACSNGEDDDRDGFTDFPEDLGCGSQNDNTEVNPPQCNDGRDNDGNGLVDFGPGPRDPGCDSPADTTERLSAPATAQCADGVDNDADGKVDYPNDPGCVSRADSDEADPPVPPACADGLDNDGDLRIDLADPGCSSASDNDEFHTIIVLGQGSAVPRLPLLTPFPIIRIRGSADKKGVRITLLTVRAPATSTVSIYCTGPSCPRKRVVIKAGRALVRVRQFEKRLRNGTVLKIYVTQPGFVGKYTRFRLLRNRLPMRADRCVTRPGTRPRACPVT